MTEILNTSEELITEMRYRLIVVRRKLDHGAICYVSRLFLPTGKQCAEGKGDTIHEATSQAFAHASLTELAAQS